MITDVNNPAASALADSAIPVCWDTVSQQVIGAVDFNHVPAGANTLYLDGHVEFNNFPGKFPASRGFAVLSALF